MLMMHRLLRHFGGGCRVGKTLGGCAGQMSDAGEVLMVLYEHLKPVAAKAGQPRMLDGVFGLHVKV